MQHMTEKGLNFEELRGKGMAMVQAAHQQAAQMEVAATDEIEKLSVTLVEKRRDSWWYPIPSMYGIFTYILVDVYGKCR